MVHHCVEALANMGVAEISTPAMSESETTGFLRAGFAVTTRLHLLSHDLGNIPGPTTSGPPTMRRGPNDTPLLLSVDHAAFRADWRMDEDALRAAAAATPSVRIRTTGPRQAPVAFAITGRAGRRGYLQRLAVNPSVHRQGHGRALVTDALRWCRRWHARRVVVNTQEGNEPALSLYEAMGFERADKGLVVLGLSLDGVTVDRSEFAS
jgi:GNAT superfamily N-acetyltransferase